MPHPSAERGLVNDVFVKAIPRLQGDWDILDAKTLSILGDAPKVLLVARGTRNRECAYIAKAPRREGPRECVAEHLISCIGRELPIRLAASRLVRMRPRVGPVPGADDPKSRNYCPEDVRFLSRFFLAPSESLVHGVELVAQCFDIDEGVLHAEIRGRKVERGFYTVALVDNVLEYVARGDENYAQLRDAFARMMALDALVGANDRHAQNWGVLVDARDPNKLPRFAPVFDTARGLFWNHSDAKLREKQESGQREQFIRNYAENSTPLIGVEGIDDPTHFDVIDHMVNHSLRGFRSPIRHLVAAFRPKSVEKLLDRAVGHYFSRLRLGYIRDLLIFRHSELRRICKL